MPPQVAFALLAALITWLIVRDERTQEGVSRAIWIPSLWLFILGSRPLSTWPLAASFGISAFQVQSADDYLEGSPFDRMVFLGLIVLGVWVLRKRRVRISEIFRDNRWLCVFFIYLGISTLWSEYPFVAFKRWIKDLGNVVMVLVILTEANPIGAVKSVLIRCSYALILLSVLFIKYFPDIGRYYSPFTWTYHYGGVTTDKNMLGISLFVCTLYTFWSFMELRKTEAKWSLESTVHVAVMISALWLFHMASSSTSLSCSFLGAGIIYACGLEPVRKHLNQAIAITLVVGVLLVLADSVLNIRQMIVEGLGRDMTLTGRTDIWKIVLSEPIDPLIGVGFYSFWLGDRPERLSERFWFHLNESHNGYLETYLNSGLIGVALLATLLIWNARRISTEVQRGEGSFAAMRLAFLLCIIIYNITEATFNRLSPIWFMFLLVVIEMPRFQTAPAESESADALEDEPVEEEEPAAQAGWSWQPLRQPPQPSP
ncbi:MAG: O-antigen ligase family protein [Verrucomicrobiota bacterium]